ncbi:hypothetical protein [Rhodoferax sp.]|uniref:hypothetical protein n=1 Tax=Rhodoferax sp. TaxID=50421 RepID=UPI0028448304|nr:hypothetical protein [Rhodoferax sp.]MDR3370614.1 hypothetical protein [Rhodoferax sp.]
MMNLPRFKCLESRLWHWALLPALLLATSLTHAQSSCNSDGQPMPSALFERFINADCATCWTDTATPIAPPGALVLDWIVPGGLGDEAALSAAASSDAPSRLQALQRLRPATQAHQESRVDALPGATLRVARGPAVNGYVGVSISLTLPRGTSLAWPLSGWVVLMEPLPRGTEGSPVPRNLIRNALQPLWNGSEQLSNRDQLIFKDLRAMSFPEGTHADRLEVAIWVQDAQGRILAATQSACPPEDKN